MFKKLRSRISTAYFHRSLRGYRQFNKATEKGRIKAIQKGFINQSVFETRGGGNPLIFGKSLDVSNLVIRQYLYKRSLLKYLPSAIYVAQTFSNKRVIFPLPSEWQDILVLNGVSVHHRMSTFLWFSFSLSLWLHGSSNTLILLFKSIYFRKRNSLLNPGRYVYFESLSNNNFPPENSENTYDIISWYLSRYNVSSDLETICHKVQDQHNRRFKKVRLTYLKTPVPLLESNRELGAFFKWASLVFFSSLLDLVRGDWRSAIMLGEATKAKIVQLSPPDRLAKQYLFNNSAAVYRPLWTYEAEAKGSEIIFYYYSTNVDGFHFSTDIGQNNFSSSMMNWPKYFVWNKYQVEFLTRITKSNFNYEIVGPIWFSDSPEICPYIDERSVAVFDVPPQTLKNYHILGLDFDYYIPKIATKFCQDVVRISSSENYQVIWKRKRDIGPHEHRIYVNFLRSLLQKHPDIVELEPNISAFRVIEKAAITISMPFTSTALIAQALGKPSCYYDASGLLSKDDPSAHGIPILSSPEELQCWLANL